LEEVAEINKRRLKQKNAARVILRKDGEWQGTWKDES
jgi:hypothetical protein